jgi:CubicO group peptidase (beta-lactamase class C family)
MIRIQLSRLASTILLAVLLAVSSVGAYAQDTEPTLRQRLAKLTEDLEKQLLALHIPGMAMAIVQGDQIIYSQGFGYADLKNSTRVTTETLFAIGSSTKAFTASLIGMLVDEGKMSWDDPVTKFLPYFKLKINTDDPEATVTMRDLLSHRTGFSRMDLLWAGGNVSREDVLRTATRAEPWAPFRKRFHYNNVTFLAAGMASSAVTGTSWDALLAERLFTPLGMKSSSSSIRLAQRDDRLSYGYRWNKEAQVYEHRPMRLLDSIGPAGAINSNVLDMAQWLRFQLGRGTFDGRVLLSEIQHGETWRKQIEVGSGMDYGMGWMLRNVAGHRLVEHGGNIDGFAAQVGLFPDVDLGFVLLTNVTITPLQGFASKLVVDALLAEWPEGGEMTSVGENLEAYPGKYDANFGPFKDTHFTVMVQNDRLAIDVPGQMVYQLDPPDDEGKWYFSMTNEIAVSFDRERDGSIVGLKMYQAGMTFELPRRGVKRQAEAEIDLSKLQPYLGKYHAEAKDIDFEVMISNQTLAVDVPGEMLYELFPPNEEARWVFRATDRVAVSFNEADHGEVTSMKLFRDGKQRLELHRVKGPDQAALPTVEEILALRRQRTGGSDTKSFRLTGRLRLVHAGLEGQVTYLSDGHGRFRSEIDFGQFGWIHQVVSKDQGWVDSNIRPAQKLEGKYLTQAIVAHALVLPEHWLPLFDQVKVTGIETLDNRKAYTLQLRIGALPTIMVSIDAETGDLLRYDMSELDPNLGITIRTVTQNEDYRDVEGVRAAFRSVSKNAFVGETVFVLEQLETDIAIDERLF